jgi:pullulanase-type alpha-1,6-glucosidase
MTGALLISAGAALAEEVTFTLEPPEGMAVESVSLRGSFNGWGETPMELQDDGTWTTTVELDAGEHQYKYFINGQWPANMETDLDGYPVDPTADGYVDDGHGGLNAIRIVGGGAPASEETFEAAPALAGGTARIHYHRPRGGYDGWGLHVWKDSAEEGVTWPSPLEPAGRDEFGLYWDVALTDGATELGFIIHKGDTKDPGPDMFLPVGDGREVWLISGSPDMHTSVPDVTTLALGDLSKLRGHWLDRRTIAWKARHAEGNVYMLHASPDGALALSQDGVTGGESLVLERAGNRLPPELVGRFPHLSGHAAFVLSDEDLARVPEILKGQLAVSVTGADGKLADAAGLQIPGVLDDLFAYDGPLGVTWDGRVPTISVWAPTAKMMRLHLFGSSRTTEPVDVVDMVKTDGVWSATGDSSWNMLYYLLEVGVFVPRTGSVEWNLVTDPYSYGLSRNSARSQVVNLDDPSLKPQGWDDLRKPPLEAPEDIVIYELHVRDYSASDPTVPEMVRGTFLAFALPSNGATHLRALAEAGLTHVHLLPSFDIATVDENKANWLSPGDLSVHPPDSDQQQAAIARISGNDPYNWGYDPFHFGTPEGSYSTVPDGPIRINEFRQMVKSLSDMGLRVVMDVVYNHTNSSGQADKSVFDKIVPGYYHRLNPDGFVETSTCCQNTATEHYMMERFMVDDLVHWATDYKIDGFRFDLMGHHMKSNMVKVRDALRALTVEEHGVDGNAIYLYGEGWDFGEVAGGRRGENAVQFNMAGTGIGTFNDRIRDAVRGGSPFADRRDQGFATGLYTDPNGFNGSGSEELGRLLGYMNRIRFGMTGNLRDYLLIDHNGREILGAQYEGVGYAADPQEAINYVSAHDNETFFDKIQYAAPADATLDDRVRMQNLALSVVALGQGIPFFHAGSDMLRSKSMEADSYNSGDWFNRLDWSYEANNFGVGLPSAEKNRDRWDIIRPLLAREDITPGRDEIMRTVHHFRELLKIRKSTILFRLRTAEDVQARTRFYNVGPDQIPGLIVMGVSDEIESRPIDTNYRRVLVFLNGTTDAIVYDNIDWKGTAFELHPVHQASHDEVVRGAAFDGGEGAFTIPARTAAVFVQPR